ncbi:MAG: hypothetical protein LKI24_17065 [Acidipropionibacterium sp.]|nr:hypothetical protein [Acidipropionibacterium sp.]
MIVEGLLDRDVRVGQQPGDGLVLGRVQAGRVVAAVVGDRVGDAGSGVGAQVVGALGQPDQVQGPVEGQSGVGEGGDELGLGVQAGGVEVLLLVGQEGASAS